MGWKRETLVAPKGLKRLALKTPDARFDHLFDHQFDHFVSVYFLPLCFTLSGQARVRVIGSPALAIPNGSIRPAFDQHLTRI